MYEKPIPGYEGKYLINRDGEVIRPLKNGKRRILRGFKEGNIWVVKLTINGVSKNYNLGRLVYEVFIHSIPQGYVIKRKNNLISDNRLLNLSIITKTERGKSTGGRSRNKQVELLDDDGEVIDSWMSARRAAKALFVSYQTISDICNGKVKHKIVNVQWAKLSK